MGRRRRRCEKHPDQLYVPFDGDDCCWKCAHEKAEEEIAELKYKLSRREGRSQWVKIGYPADRVFESFLRKLGYKRAAWPNGNGERFICCAVHSEGDWFELPAKLAQGLEDAWEKIEEQIKDLQEYAVRNVFDLFKNELHDQVVKILDIDFEEAKRATLAKLKKKRG